MKIAFIASIFAVLMFNACKPAVSDISGAGAPRKSTLATAPSADTDVSSDFDLAEDPSADSDLK